MNFTKHYSLSTLYKLSIVILILLFAAGGSSQKAEAAKGYVQIKVTSTYPLKEVWVTGVNQYGRLTTWKSAPDGAWTAATTNWWWKPNWIWVLIQYQNGHIQQKQFGWTSSPSDDWKTASFTYYGTDADNPKRPAISSPIPGPFYDRTIRFQLSPASPNYTGKRNFSVGVEQINGDWLWTSGWTSDTSWNIPVPSDGRYRFWAQQGDTVNRGSPVVTTVIEVKRDIGQPKLTAPKDATSKVEVTITPGSVNYTGKADWLVQCYSDPDNPDGSIVKVEPDGWMRNPKQQIAVKYVGDLYCRVRQGDTVNNSSTWSTSAKILMLYDRVKAIDFADNAILNPTGPSQGGNVRDGEGYGVFSDNDIGRHCATYVAYTMNKGNIPIDIGNNQYTDGNDDILRFLSKGRIGYGIRGGVNSIEQLAKFIRQHPSVESVAINEFKGARPGDAVFFNVNVALWGEWVAQHSAIVTDGVTTTQEPLLAYWNVEKYDVFEGLYVTFYQVLRSFPGDVLVIKFKGDDIQRRTVYVYDRAKAIAFAAATPSDDNYGGNYNDGNNYGFPSDPPLETDVEAVDRECAAYVARTLKAGGIPVWNAGTIVGNDQVFGFLSNNTHTYPFGSRSIADLAARIRENYAVDAVEVVKAGSSYNTSKLRPGDVVFFNVQLVSSTIGTNYRWGAVHAAIITDGKYNNEPLLAYWHVENYQIFQKGQSRGKPITLKALSVALGNPNFLVVRFQGDEIAWKQISVPTVTPPPSVTPNWTIVPSATSTWIPTQTSKPSSTFTATPSITSSRTPIHTSTSTLMPTATVIAIGFDAFARNEAATFTGKNGTAAIVPCSEGGQNVSGLADGSNFYFSNMNFGSGAKAMQVRLAAASGANAVIDIWVDYPGTGGILLATLPVPNTNDAQAWRTIALNIQPVSGVHALYFSFRGTWNPNDVGIKWFQFFAESAPTPIYTATSTATPTKTYTPTPPPTFTATNTPIPVTRFRGRMYFTQTISNIDTAYGYIEHFNFYLDRTYDILLDLGKNSGTLQYDLVLADASGNTIQLAKSSVNGRGILFRQLGAGWYNVFVISKVGSNAVFNLTIYQGFGWLCPNCVQEAYTDVGLWQWTPNVGTVHSFEIQAIDGIFNFNVTVYNAAGTLYTGNSVNGYLKFNLTMGSGQHWMRLNFTGGSGSYTVTRR
ncbi:MAG: carbohydrate-binding protein [Anaerolineae bacterium]|nr:carbohydrate-binding protein [Anaerolineae bacterium]